MWGCRSEFTKSKLAIAINCKENKKEASFQATQIGQHLLDELIIFKILAINKLI